MRMPEPVTISEDRDIPAKGGAAKRWLSIIGIGEDGVEGLSTADVASILQSSETTVRSQVSRGRLKLKAAIDRMTGGHP